MGCIGHAVRLPTTFLSASWNGNDMLNVLEGYQGVAKSGTVNDCRLPERESPDLRACVRMSRTMNQ